MMIPWRLFVGIPVVGETRERLASWCLEQRRRVAGWRWVAAENLHLTLRFLGSTEPGRLAPLEAALRRAFDRPALPALTVKGWGTFPVGRRPRVLWAGLSGNLTPLADLAGEVEHAVCSLGFAPEQKPFRPHLTLARVDRDRAVELPKSDRDLTFGTFPVEPLILFRSHLGIHGARYEPVVSIAGRTGTPHA